MPNELWKITVIYCIFLAQGHMLCGWIWTPDLSSPVLPLTTMLVLSSFPCLLNICSNSGNAIKSFKQNDPIPIPAIFNHWWAVDGLPSRSQDFGWFIRAVENLSHQQAVLLKQKQKPDGAPWQFQHLQFAKHCVYSNLINNHVPLDVLMTAQHIPTKFYPLVQQHFPCNLPMDLYLFTTNIN